MEESYFLEELTRLVDDQRVRVGEQLQNLFEVAKPLLLDRLVFEEALAVLEDGQTFQEFFYFHHVLFN